MKIIFLQARIRHEKANKHKAKLAYQSGLPTGLTWIG